MNRITPERWEPVDGFVLEPNALQVVRSERSTLVTAGPGAGKTELLAQRADYLLRTGLCVFPRKILAVSLKVDAANNLRDRVAKRCADGVNRFESVTLDAFSKRLVDRFRLALPEQWQPAADYAPRVRGPNDRDIGSFIDRLNPPPQFGGRAGRHTIQRQGFINRLAGDPIPWPASEAMTLDEWTFTEYWHWAVSNSHEEGGTLPFPMIARLAELILRTNPAITKGLRAAYAFVFLDEFQDITYWHYDLIHRAFAGSLAPITAVGDTKQMIMGWAGADASAGERFVRDYNATQTPLLLNHRAAPELVRILNSLARMVDPEASDVSSAVEQEGVSACEVHWFSNAEHEADFIANIIAGNVASGIKPSEHCVIVRQRCDVMSEPVIAKLREQGIHARDETQYQDLLKEVLVDIVLCAMILADGTPNPKTWMRLCEWTCRANGFEADDSQAVVSTDVRTLVKTTAALLNDATEVNEAAAIRLIGGIVDAFGTAVLRTMVPAYESERWFAQIIERTAALLYRERTWAETWIEAAKRFLGEDVVPAMTIHKSKGLEYDTVCFVGLEDSSWWAYAREPDENTRSFFVAFSRAKRQVMFTFAESRDAGQGPSRQTINNIRPLYEALRAAGVAFTDHRRTSLT